MVYPPKGAGVSLLTAFRVCGKVVWNLRSAETEGNHPILEDLPLECLQQTLECLQQTEVKNDDA